MLSVHVFPLKEKLRAKPCSDIVIREIEVLVPSVFILNIGQIRQKSNITFDFKRFLTLYY